ncbi:NeuD/PglB/VioB family sugar acetyltransferase [Fulvivirgaceae bacterium PWU4]|uniref:NeuD/PglB/VioB family sugar acetyltransferase n=1 Tax=Chryseosolibacter histidini TaxID=2782349 RepID=A0AAP2DJW4_9BACT|nr:NeuD/PglB/VioB family sugar acetyltransferase [Chryseosolibacter histidini]MBT1696342.1 NeuD/PglB/VioB family sugar acetyltransferase [Chryseosolibacter histidini]
MDNPVIIFGASFLGRAAKEIFEGNGNVVYGFLDDNKNLHATEIDNVTVLGATDDDGYLKLIGKKCEAFVAVDDNKVRKNLVKMIQEVRHVQPVNAIHKNALLASSATMGHGNFIDVGVKAGAGVEIGNHCLVHANVVLGAEVRVADFVQIGAGSIINPGVTVEEEAFIGSGVVIVSGLTIGKGARVGAGSVVIAPVKAGETVFGNPAEKVNA